MCGTTHTAHRDTHVNGRTETLVKEVRVQINLTIGNRNYVGRNVSRNVTSLCFDDRECGERTTTFHLAFQTFRKVVHLFGYLLLIVNLSSTFKQTWVQVEHIARISLTTWRTTQNQWNFAVSNRLFWKVVIHYQGVQTTIAEVFTNSSTCKRRIILHCSRFASCGTHNDGIIHCACLLQRINDVSYGRSLLTDSYVDAIYRVAFGKVLLLVDNGINSNCGLTCLAVANDKFALSTTDRNHGVDTLQTRLKSLGHRLTINNTRCFAVEGHQIFFAFDSLSTINRVAERVDNTSEHLVANLNRGNLGGTLHALSLFNTLRGTEQHGTHIVLLKVHGNTHYAIFKFDKLILRNVGKTIDVSHTIANRENNAHLFKLDIGVDILKFAQKNFANFTGFYIVGHLICL